MPHLRSLVPLASISILVLCVIAAGLLLIFAGDIDEGFMWYALAFYFLAKGIFCSMMLYLTFHK